MMKTTQLPPLMLQAWHLAPCRMASHPTPEGSSRLRNLLGWRGIPANRPPTLTYAALPQPLLQVSQIYRQPTLHQRIGMNVTRSPSE